MFIRHIEIDACEADEPKTTKEVHVSFVEKKEND